MNRIAILSTTLAALALSVVTASAAEGAPSASRGRTLFLNSGCKHCHGTQGQGTNSGKRLAPNPLPVEAMAQLIRAPGTRMPAYSPNVLSDADIADIAAYLATMLPAKSPDAIAILKDLKPMP
jgi:mono/diheme cytochrome c family protein